MVCLAVCRWFTLDLEVCCLFLDNQQHLQDFLMISISIDFMMAPFPSLRIGLDIQFHSKIQYIHHIHLDTQGNAKVAIPSISIGAIGFAPPMIPAMKIFARAPSRRATVGNKCSRRRSDELTGLRVNFAHRTFMILVWLRYHID